MPENHTENALTRRQFLKLPVLLTTPLEQQTPPQTSPELLRIKLQEQLASPGQLRLDYEAHLKSLPDDPAYKRCLALMDLVDIFQPNPKIKSLYPISREEIKQEFLLYAPIYIHASRQTGIPPEVLFQFHAIESDMSKILYPDGSFWGCMQRSRAFYSNNLVEHLSSDSKYLEFAPQRYNRNPLIDGISETIFTLQHTDPNNLSPQEQQLYESEKLRLVTLPNKFAKTKDYQEIQFAAWKLANNTQQFINRGFNPKQALRKAYYWYSSEWSAYNRWSQFTALTDIAQANGLDIPIEINNSNPNLNLNPKDFK